MIHKWGLKFGEN